MIPSLPPPRPFAPSRFECYKPTMSDTTRLEALEIRVAHQDATIDDLNATITAQWRKIEALARDVAVLGDRLHDLGRREPGEVEPPPPHY